MKLSYYFFPALITPVFSDILNIFELLENRTTSLPSLPHQRHLQTDTAPDVSTWIDLIMTQGYGCWCYFFEYSLSNGKGQPKDNLDRACKALHDGYWCIIQDSLIENQDCQTPWTVVYNGYAQNQGTIYSDCEAQNPGDWCKIRSCAVESEFVHNLLNVIGGSPGSVPQPGTLPNQNLYGHVDAGFQADIECLRAGTSGLKQCCGSYPTRSICPV